MSATPERSLSPVLADLDVLGPVLRTWRRRHPPEGRRPDEPAAHEEGEIAPVELVAVEPLAPPGSPLSAPDPSRGAFAPRVLGVLGQEPGRLLHAVLGLRSLEEDLRPIVPGDDTFLGVLELPGGPVAAVDALMEADLAIDVLGTLTGHPSLREGAIGLVEAGIDVVVAVDDRLTFTAFPWPVPGGDPGVEMLMALDEAGFNHLAAPLARWCAHGLDLGVVQERAVGMASGWAIALTSLRDLFASGSAPQDAGGDFAPEASALGTMTARMHLALAEVFGTGQPATGDTARVQRTHGDLHLGRTARTDQGWILLDAQPGGSSRGSATPEPRSPLADLADLAWSFRRAAAEALAEQPQDPEHRLVSLSEAWKERNTVALVQGYLREPGIDALVRPEPGAALRTVTRLANARAALQR